MLTTRRTLLSPIFSSAALVVAAACGGGTSVAPVDGGAADGGAADVTSPVDSGASDADTQPDTDQDGGVIPKALADGEVALFDVTTDGHAIYWRFTGQDTRALEAVDVASGVTTTIRPSLPPTASVAVRGNAVAIWTDIDQATGLGTFNYWTPGSSLQSNVGSLSLRDTFWASADGKKIAFYKDTTLVQAIPTDAELVVISTTTGEQAAVLTGAERVAFDETSCGSHIGFTGRTLVAAYCPSGDMTARLVVVPDVAAPARRVLVGDGLLPFWSADETGSRIFVIAAAAEEGRVVTNDGTDPAPSSPLDTNVKEGFMLRDGSAVVYRKDMTLRRAPLGAPGPIAPVTITTEDVRGIVDVTADRGSILFRSLPGRPVIPQEPDGERYFDLRTIQASATNSPSRVLVDTERALPLSLTGGGTHALYFSPGPRLKAVALDGSGEHSMPVQFNGMDVAPWGSGVILSTNDRQFGLKTVLDLVYVDFATSSAPSPKLVAESVPSTGFRFAGPSSKKLVYVRAATERSGLFSLDLP